MRSREAVKRAEIEMLMELLAAEEARREEGLASCSWCGADVPHEIAECDPDGYCRQCRVRVSTRIAELDAEAKREGWRV